MPESTLMERALALAVDNTEPVTTMSPPPTASAGTQAALRKCRTAWQRAFNESMKNSDGASVDEVFAARDAAQAYCRAMPLLAGPDGVRDFIACAAYGILIGAIPPERSGQVLYAAQIALCALPNSPKIR
jgi:hypothetical protein